MTWQKTEVSPGLYLISTPIGSARDITLRALDVFASADVLAAEDTRTLRRLMDIHGVQVAGRPLIAYHDHSGPAARSKLLSYLADGKAVAYAPEAGTPLIADPGFVLGREAIAAGHAVVAIPGPSAVLAALTVAGLPTDRFFFAGFPPSTRAARQRFLSELSAIPATTVFYESPKRVGALLTDLMRVFGGQRNAAVCRELTKKFEETVRGRLSELAVQYEDTEPKGEIVVLVDRPEKWQATEEEVQMALEKALASMSMKDAAEMVAIALGRPKREVYQAALKLSKGG